MFILWLGGKVRVRSVIYHVLYCFSLYQLPTHFVYDCIGYMYYPIVGSDTFVMTSYFKHVLAILVISKAL